LASTTTSSKQTRTGSVGGCPATHTNRAHRRSASTWESHPDALLGWVANVVPYALGVDGIEPTLESLESFVGAGYRYATENAAGLPESDQALAKSIRELSRVLQSLMRLKSTEPFNPPAPSAA
jgi:hypothetical protein